jgi:hypothetical protein
MKNGIELITEERQEQIEKHKRTITKDILNNPNKELIVAARELLDTHPSNMGFPKSWDKIIVHRMASKSYQERLIIAGALIAAELDRLQS